METPGRRVLDGMSELTCWLNLRARLPATYPHRLPVQKNDSAPNKDMTSPNTHFYTGDEEDTPCLCPGKEISVKRFLLVVGGGNHVKTFIGSFCDKLFGRVSYGIEGIFCGMKM